MPLISTKIIIVVRLRSAVELRLSTIIIFVDKVVGALSLCKECGQMVPFSIWNPNVGHFPDLLSPIDLPVTPN